ncbi:MAG: porin family protein [Deltaproteobacteria bacterium]
MSRRPLAYLLIGVLLGARPGALRAQEPGTQLGFELGYSRARFQPAGGLNDSRDGSLIAGFVSRRIVGPLSGQVELMFSRRGGGLTAQTAAGTTVGTVQLIYVEVPLLARVSLPVGRLRPVLLGGGSLAVSVGCELQAEGVNNVEQQRCDGAGADPSLAGTDFSAIVGGGLEYPWRGSYLRLEVRRTIGLHNLLASDPLKSRVWAVLAGITF